MKKYYLIIALILVSLSFVGAESNLGTFKQNDTIQLFQSCDSCTYVNLSSVKIPNGTILLFNTDMTKNATSYTSSFSLTSLIGDYKYEACGDKGTVLTCETIDFHISKSGNNFKTQESISYFGLIFLLSIFLTISIYFSVNIPFQNTRDFEGNIIGIQKLKYLKIIAIFVSYSLLTWISNLALELTNNYVFLGISQKLMEIILSVLIALIYPLFIATIITLVIMGIRDSKITKLLDGGFKV